MCYQKLVVVVSLLTCVSLNLQSQAMKDGDKPELETTYTDNTGKSRTISLQLRHDFTKFLSHYFFK